MTTNDRFTYAELAAMIEAVVDRGMELQIALGESEAARAELEARLAAVEAYCTALIADVEALSAANLALYLRNNVLEAERIEGLTGIKLRCN